MNKHILILSLLLAITFQTVAQEKVRAYEAREMARSKKIREEVNAKIDQKRFELTAVPEEFKNESVVVLALYAEFAYLRSMKYLYRHETLRKRFMLQDEAALEEFSEFYYKKGVNIFVNIIKPDGEISEVDLDEAVDVKDGIPSHFRTLYNYNKGYQKIALPNLEVGDIIDYTYISKGTEYLYSKIFEPFIFFTAQKFPVVFRELNFDVDRGYFINFNSFNGAGELKENGIGNDENGKPKQNIARYTYREEMVDKIQDEEFIHHAGKQPFVKFQVGFKKPNESNRTGFLRGEPGEVKKSFTQSEIRNSTLAKINRFRGSGNPSYTGMMTYIKEKGITTKDPVKLAEEIYYYLQYELESKDGSSLFPEGGNFYYGHFFAAIALDVFKRQKMRMPKITISSSKVRGGLDAILLNDDLVIGLLIERKGEKYYLTAPSLHSTFLDVDDNSSGSDCYIINEDKKITGITKGKIPEDLPNKNKVKRTYEIAFDSDMTKAMIKKNTVMTGKPKLEYSGLVLYADDYRLKLFPKYNPRFKGLDISKRADRNAERKAEHKESKEERNKILTEYIESLVGSQNDLDEYENIKIVNNGKKGNRSELIYEETYSLNNVITKAGRNYFLNIGGLLPHRGELDQKEERVNDFKFGYPEVRAYDYIITLPEGYSIKGLDNLNFEHHSDYCDLVSKATLVENVLTINFNRTFNNRYLDASISPTIVEYYKMIFKLGEAKLLLSKNK